MTYASGGLIEATDYGTAANLGFVGCVNAIWGTGTGDAGYGQTELPPVAAATTVTAVQWQNLIDRIDKMRQHQSGVTSGLTSPSPGSIITFLSTLTTQLSTITTNRLSITGVQTTANATAMTNATGWIGTAVKEVSYSWPNANAMRYFFNAGGYVSFTGANSALAGNTKSTDWDALLTACGVVRINAQSSQKVGGSGTPTVNNTNLGFYDLTTSDQTILQQYSTTATGGYNTNFATFQARLNAAPGSATVLFMKMTLTDASADVLDDTVTGTVQLDFSHTPPITTYLANTWGAATANNAVTNTQV